MLMRLILCYPCLPLCDGALWPIPAFVWCDVRSAFIFIFGLYCGVLFTTARTCSQPSTSGGKPCRDFQGHGLGQPSQCMSSHPGRVLAGSTRHPGAPSAGNGATAAGTGRGRYSRSGALLVATKLQQLRPPHAYGHPMHMTS